jgi:TM2 domain-containing membrane protein YozV
MADTENGTTYYIRVRGRVLGPYDVAQLKTLRGRGQFGRANEVSTDRQTWQSAAIIEQLWGGTKVTATTTRRQAKDGASVADTAGSGPPSPTLTPVWHYAVGTEHSGPVTVLELRGMIASSQLMPDDNVWKEGMADWIPIRDVAELNAVAKSNAGASVSQTTSGTMALQIFCYACGSPTDARAEVCPKCGVRQPQHSAASEKKRMTVAVLAMLFGGLGAQNFYLGRTLEGVLCVLFCWTLIPSILGFIDCIRFLCMSDATFADKYGQKSISS